MHENSKKGTLCNSSNASHMRLGVQIQNIFHQTRDTKLHKKKENC